MCVCKREEERERERVCVSVNVCTCVRGYFCTFRYTSTGICIHVRGCGFQRDIYIEREGE